jgi:hypothetical protein
LVAVAVRRLTISYNKESSSNFAAGVEHRRSLDQVYETSIGIVRALSADRGCEAAISVATRHGKPTSR